MRIRTWLHLSLTLSLAAPAWAGRDPGGLPAPVTGDHFRALIENSPFTRSLDLSESLVLTGIAVVGGRPVATLLDTEAGRSLSVSEIPNARGWKMVEVEREEDLESTVATIAIESGQVFRVRYDKERVESTSQRMRYQARARAQRLAAKTKSPGNGGHHGVSAERVALLNRIEQTELPKGYNPGAGRNREEAHRIHQNYVDRRIEGMTGEQKGQLGRLWSEKQRVNPGMPNRGASFVRILEHVANGQ